MTTLIAKIKARSDVNPKQGLHEYGDVHFADAKNHKYPIDTEEHVRAAWSYINMPKNAAKYGSKDLSRIKSAIRGAAKRMGVAIAKDGSSAPSMDSGSLAAGHVPVPMCGHLGCAGRKRCRYRMAKALPPMAKGDKIKLKDGKMGRYSHQVAPHLHAMTRGGFTRHFGAGEVAAVNGEAC